MLAELVAEASAEPAFADYAPAGLMNVVHGLGPEVGQALVADPKVKAISFTGGTATGAMVGQTAAGRFAKASLELGELHVVTRSCA
jgi:aminomuconate-semialdehyde/2-hydroxymuconate-6-semialdehyde dehydrogenase